MEFHILSDWHESLVPDPPARTTCAIQDSFKAMLQQVVTQHRVFLIGEEASDEANTLDTPVPLTIVLDTRRFRLRVPSPRRKP